MPIQIPLTIVRRDAIQRVAHVGAHVLVPVLVQREAAAGVLHEEMQSADFVGLQLGQGGDDFVGDEVAAARARGESECFLEPGHVRLHFSALGLGLGGLVERG